jgi:hypothetical protein
MGCGMRWSQGQLLLVGWTRQADLEAQISEYFLGIIVLERRFFLILYFLGTFCSLKGKKLLLYTSAGKRF